MSFANRFTPAPAIRPFLNMGCLFDIPTGSYRPGKHGESILNGGLAPITGIGGRGNTYKSTLAHFMTLRTLDRYLSSDAVVNDTEESLEIGRLFHLARWMPYIGGVDLQEEGRLILTAKTVMPGNKWFDAFRDYMKERRKDPKEFQKTTPFVDKKGDPIKAFVPVVGEVDSFSAMEIEALDKLYDAHEVGESGLNIEALKGAAAKSQLMMQLPGVTGMGGGYVILTAHVGDEHQLDPYAPPAKKLTFLKGKVKFKRVPENFTFLTNNCWYCLSATVMINQTTKAPEFPRNKEDDLKGDTDLMLITLQNLRAKSGPTGLPMEVIASQRDGIHVGLTEMNYLKHKDNKTAEYKTGWGIGGHDKSYYLELYPSANLQRTTVRGKIDADPKLQRALEITSEMCQMRNLWHHLPDGVLCTPQELYDTLKAKGYDWDLLLDTRGYWVYEEDVTPSTKPFLSTMDLLNMRLGKYHPYWYPVKEKDLKVKEEATA